jgi:p-hydroxybenzoate 3-monooxygenase
VARTPGRLSKLLHTYPDQAAYDQQLQATELAYLFSSDKAQAALVKN